MLSRSFICLAGSIALTSCSINNGIRGGAASVGFRSQAEEQQLEAEVRELETRLAQAFLRNDMASVARAIAPDFLIASSANGKTEFQAREEWLRRLSGFTFLEYSTGVLDVVSAGGTAVATIEGHRRVKAEDGNVRSLKFIATDTWVRQEGQWQLLSRHSHLLPEGASQ